MTDREEEEVVDTSKPSPLSDLTNVKLVVVDEGDEANGMNVENAYRHLTGLPPEPAIAPEEF